MSRDAPLFRLLTASTDAVCKFRVRTQKKEDFMRNPMIGCCVFALLIVGIPAFAQKENPLVGTWDTVAGTADGKDNMPSANGAPAGAKPGIPLRVFTADGHYVILTISTGRPVINKPQDRQTLEDVRSNYWGISGNHGTYSIFGDKVTFKVRAAMWTSFKEGDGHAYTFRFDGADLVLTGTDPMGRKSMTRWRRAK
jgi:YD repeat-containing protein